jgi:electron transport complex protein RnfC
LPKISFKGGVHPKDHKHTTRYLHITNIPATKEIVLPLSQHIGGRSNPVVKPGDEVKIGDLIAESAGVVSANIHASVSGKVIAIEPRLHNSGYNVESVVIENDGKYTIGYTKEDNKWSDMSAHDIIERVKRGGIVGMGGATFPTHVKLAPPKDKPIDSVILNGAECEPYITSDHRLMLEFPEKVVVGLKIIMRALNANNGYIAIEENKRDAIDTIKAYIAPEDNIKVVTCAVKYPQGAEKTLIKAATKRLVPHGRLPMDVGVCVDNVATASAIYDIVVNNKPLVDRIVTVAGGAIKTPKNFCVPFGVPIGYLIEQAGGLNTADELAANSVIMGGPMMGVAQFSLDAPITKGSNALLALTDEEAFKGSETACLRCGKCIEACPMNLQPIRLYESGKLRDVGRARDASITDCIECGACTFVCPAKKHIVQYIRVMKSVLSKN